MYGQQSFNAVHKTVHLVKFQNRQGLLNFFLGYSTVGELYGTYLAAQQQYKLIQFPVCDNVGVLFSLEILAQASEKHIQTQFSLWQFRFWSI